MREGKREGGERGTGEREGEEGKRKREEGTR